MNDLFRCPNCEMEFDRDEFDPAVPFLPRCPECGEQWVDHPNPITGFIPQAVVVLMILLAGPPVVATACLAFTSLKAAFVMSFGLMIGATLAGAVGVGLRWGLTAVLAWTVVLAVAGLFLLCCGGGILLVYGAAMWMLATAPSVVDWCRR